MFRAFLTRRLRLEPLSQAHAVAMHPVLDDVSLHEFIGGRPLPFLELAARYRKLALGASDDGLEVWINYIVHEKISGEAVGTVQATVIALGDERHAKIAWVIGAAWQGKGYASEATRGLLAQLQENGVHAVAASIHAEHIASQRVARSIGLSPTTEIDDGEQVWRLKFPRDE